MVKLQEYEESEATYSELKLLGRRYRYYMELHVKALQEQTHVLDYAMPGIKRCLTVGMKLTERINLAILLRCFGILIL